MTRPLGRRLGLGFAAIAVAAALLTALVVNLAFSSRFDTYLEQQRSARTGSSTRPGNSSGRPRAAIRPAWLRCTGP